MVGMRQFWCAYGRQTVLRVSIKSAYRAGPEAGAPGTNAKLSSFAQADNRSAPSIDTQPGTGLKSTSLSVFGIRCSAFSVQCSMFVFIRRCRA
jgi:hypothetical protein